MTDPTMAMTSDVAIWVAIAVLALALIAFSVHLALAGAATERKADVRTRAKVGAAVAGGSIPGGALGSTFPGDRVEELAPAEPTATGAALAPPTDIASTGTARRWGVIGLQLTWLATLLVVAGTVLRMLSVTRAPLGNMYEFVLVTASFALLVYSGWSLRRARLWLGIFVVLPVTLMLVAAKLWWYTEASQLMPALESLWLVIHVTIACLSIALFVIGAALASAYLLKDRAETQGRVRGWLAALPAAPALERMTYGIHVLAFPLWTFTVISGAIWAEQAWGRYWGWDPKETWSFVIWVVYAAYLHARATSSWSTRKATWVSIVGFACIIINYTVVNLLMTGLHSYSGVAT
ncbi:c-type cytochrome biogenesis protein CcsB [Ornithinimicrobium pratense]|uniref:C-type cytochrome biogenesis protein CcsB n=1 Tax=Ornithinimicrobium pratense TaxID=2593973 RepID=A0A5J6V1Y6_9MICO|nr:c-type cytochrome biogenesis protein CcsB [Ornithinimicrobium pratense]QFG67657.1 c-type cytochrome biogenesis protein CcsB [Ornithinimicrobium pratense]